MSIDIWKGLLTDEQVEALRHGEAMLAALRSGDQVDRWLAVGASLALLQSAALQRSQSNTPHGKRYQAAWAYLVAELPHLASLDKSTRSTTLWLYTNREQVVPWLQAMDKGGQGHIRLQLTHPTAIQRKWRAQHDAEGAPTKEGDSPATSAAKKQRLALQDKVLGLQDENEALRGKDRNAVVILGNDSAEIVLEKLQGVRNADWFRKLRSLLDGVIKAETRQDAIEAKAKRKR